MKDVYRPVGDFRLIDGLRWSIVDTRLILIPLLVAAGCGGSPTAPSPLTQVAAGDVADRSSLRAFVESARTESVVATADATEQEAFDFFDREFRPEGHWRQGSVYLVVVKVESAGRAISFFHGPITDLEGQNIWFIQDKNGVFITREFIRRADEGGGFVEYYFDNPDVAGDEEDGSFKVGYAAAPFYIEGTKFVVTSGFYPGAG